MSSLIQISDDFVFALGNAHFSYVFRVTPEGQLEHIYYGAALQQPLSAPRHFQRTQRECSAVFEGVPHLNLSAMPQEYPLYGRSDYRQPAFHGRNKDGNAIFSLRYAGHRNQTRKPKLEGLPSARGGESETLIVTLEDAVQDLQVDLQYTIYADYGVLARSSHLTNRGAHDIQLEHLASAALDLPAGDYDCLHLHGSWSREFSSERLAVPQGRFVVESTRGTSSAAHAPFIAVMERETTETQGHVYASALVYSGNHAVSVERGEFGDVRLLTGINPFGFSWKLSPGESFQTPEALQVFSAQGLGGMSHLWHDFIRDKISPERFKDTPRPTYLNTWEACYFDVTEDRVLALADTAKEVGVDMLVLDDGWFTGRADDTSSLGDWTADPVRFPSGIPVLAKGVKAKGLKFGLWVEPEMVNPKSTLFETHPDWILHVPDRTPSLGRNQLTLDLSRPEVVEYIYNSLDALLSCGDIDYVKWDMNRHMSEIGSAGLPPEQQSEVAHRYILGLYGLLDQLMRAHPHILFENCASGGNRFDLGMLSYMAQGWISDMCDPVGRLEIITGASYLFPLDVTAAYIGPSPNHQNGRISSVKTRFLAGIFCAAKGISLNEADIATHKDELQAFMSQAKDMAPDMLGGRFERLVKTDNEICWQFTSRDGGKVWLACFHILSGPNQPFRRACLRGLDPNADYKLEEDGQRYKGDALMQSGLPLPYVATAQTQSDIRYMDKGDFSAYLFSFRKL